MMKLEDFIQLFATQFEETEMSAFSAETDFRSLDEWDSLTGLAILNAIAKQTGVRLVIEEFRSARTIEEVYNLVTKKLA